MRLNCPNCEAQYEVPDDVIPPEGRDVQCAACGDTWFQPNPGALDADANDAPAPAEGAEDTGADTAADTRAGRRELDPDVASVLREEAAREKRARAAPPGGQDAQPARQDRPLPPVAQPSGTPKINTPPGRAGTSAPKPRDSDPSTRPSLYPDIEEINSSLASTGSGNDPSTVSSSYSGFRSGFLVAVLVALAALLIYVFAAQLGEAIPALQSALTGYVAWVDGMRGWLAGLFSPSVPD